MRICLWKLALFLLILTTSGATAAAGEEEFDAEAAFSGQCGACHTVGRGDDVGPDLAGVTERRSQEWLVAFVQSSQSVIRGGDSTAVELFDRYGRQKMPDHDYTAEQIGEILALIAAGGPASSSALRPAVEAMAQDIQAGREIFFAHDGARVACAGCHSVSEPSGVDTPALGGSLAHAFSKYRDAELARVLSRKRTLCDTTLDAEESFFVRAYLRHVDQDGGEVSLAEASFPFLSLGSLVLFLAAGWSRRRMSNPLTGGAS